MATMGSFAEANVLRKIHKEKMKRMEGEERKEGKSNEEKKPSCRIFGSSMKIHPSGFPMASSAGKPDGEENVCCLQWTSTGMYYTWEECRQQVDGFSMARFKGYKSTSEAYTQWTALCEYAAQHNEPAQHYEAVTDFSNDYQTGMLNTERPIFIASYSNLSIGRSPSPCHYCAKCAGICTPADGVDETSGSIEALLRIIFGCLLLILAIQLIAWR